MWWVGDRKQVCDFRHSLRHNTNRVKKIQYNKNCNKQFTKNIKKYLELQSKENTILSVLGNKI